MLDLHIVHTISNGVKYYTDNRNAFDEIFNDISSGLRDKYYDKLSNSKLNFDRSYSQKHNKFPLITTKIVEFTAPEEQVLGNKGHRGQGVLMVSQNCEVTVYSDDYDMMRILHRILQATMVIFKGSFLQIGYLNLQFTSSEELEPDEDITSNSVMLFRRVMTFNAKKQILATPPEAPEALVPWILNPPNVVNN